MGDVPGGPHKFVGVSDGTFFQFFPVNVYRADCELICVHQTHHLYRFCVAKCVDHVAVAVLLAVELEVPVAGLELVLEPGGVLQPLVFVGAHEGDVHVHSIGVREST